MEALQQTLSYDPGAQILVVKTLIIAALLFHTRVG